MAPVGARGVIFHLREQTVLRKRDQFSGGNPARNIYSDSGGPVTIADVHLGRVRPTPSCVGHPGNRAFYVVATSKTRLCGEYLNGEGGALSGHGLKELAFGISLVVPISTDTADHSGGQHERAVLDGQVEVAERSVGDNPTCGSRCPILAKAPSRACRTDERIEVHGAVAFVGSSGLVAFPRFVPFLELAR